MYWVDSPALNALFCFQIKHEKKKKEEGKRAREDEDVVKASLFNAFERHQYYNLKDLISITKQPVVRIAYEIQDDLFVRKYLEDLCALFKKFQEKKLQKLWTPKVRYLTGF